MRGNGERDSPSVGALDSGKRADTSNSTEGALRKKRWIGLLLAPAAALVVYTVLPVPVADRSGDLISGLSPGAPLCGPGRAVAAIGVLMAVLWVTEALPIAATALIPIALFPLLTGGTISVKSATAPYGHPLIFLFMGGFLLALAMQRWGLHRRIALHTILLVGTRPSALVGGFMIASAFLSMWVSNTATVVMMLPIATSVVVLVRREMEGSSDVNAPVAGRPFNFAICLMLGTAYASSIGGIGTLIGTPPNALLAGFLQDSYGIEISFVRWMAIGVPLVIVFLPITWVCYSPDSFTRSASKRYPVADPSSTGNSRRRGRRRGKSGLYSPSSC